VGAVRPQRGGPPPPPVQSECRGGGGAAGREKSAVTQNFLGVGAALRFSTEWSKEESQPCEFGRECLVVDYAPCADLYPALRFVLEMPKWFGNCGVRGFCVYET